MLSKTIAFIGSGAMAKTMISGLLRQGLAQPGNLQTADTRPERVNELQEKYGTQPRFGQISKMRGVLAQAMRSRMEIRLSCGSRWITWVFIPRQ